MAMANHRRASLVLALGVGLALAGFHLSACAGKEGTETRATGSAPATPAKEPVAPSKFPYARPAPAFELEDLAGKRVKLEDYRGKVVLLDFWATWCGPCKMEIPHLKELQAEFGPKGVVVVGISLDQQGKRVVEPFVKKNGIQYPILMGTRQVAQDYGGIQYIPTAFLIDRNGLIRQKYQGYKDKKVFAEDLKSLLLADS